MNFPNVIQITYLHKQSPKLITNRMLICHKFKVRAQARPMVICLAASAHYASIVSLNNKAAYWTLQRLMLDALALNAMLMLYI